MSPWLRAVALLLLAASSAGTAPAHELTMAEMQLSEVAAGTFRWSWSASEKGATNGDLQPVWPAGCLESSGVLRCGRDGLKGELAIDGVGKRYSAAIVKVSWLDGQASVHTLTSAQPRVRLYGAAGDPRGADEIAGAYLLLGVEHILSGYDHLLFVAGLLFLVGFRRRLFWTITAFTAAHSLTLASAALGWLTLRPAPVEASIALSIVLVAGEALRRRETLARRWPALVAFLFGLVHGLGFAGALQDIGLPQSHLPLALLMFNVGVEGGQLFAIGAVWLLLRAAGRWPALQRSRTAALYAIGSVAAYWSWLRAVAIFG